MPAFIYIFWTTDSKKEATNVIKLLLEKKHIACGSLLPGVTSFFRWEDQIQSASEYKVILKTKKHLFPLVAECIRENASYNTPEIVSLSVQNIIPGFASWIESVTS